MSVDYIFDAVQKPTSSSAKEPRTRTTKKSKKGDKDPNAPKRASSAYMIWLNENRKNIAKAGMSVTDVAKAAGVEWNKLEDKTVCRIFVK
jgi:structure-specific recognition protein 1